MAKNKSRYESNYESIVQKTQKHSNDFISITISGLKGLETVAGFTLFTTVLIPTVILGTLAYETPRYIFYQASRLCNQLIS